MEFYKLYKDKLDRFYRYKTGSGLAELNSDIKNNPEWVHIITNQETTFCADSGVLSTVLVHWQTENDTPFNTKD